MDPVAIFVSFVSILVVGYVTSYAILQSNKVRGDMEEVVQSVVDQINSAQYYKYKFDKLQESNIQTLDANTQKIHSNLREVAEEIKTAQDELVGRVKGLEEGAFTPQKLAAGVPYVKTGKLQLGDQHVLSGVGDGFNDTPDGWLRLMDKDGKGLYGGMAVGELWTKNQATFQGTVEVNAPLHVRGGKSTFNPQGQATQFSAAPDMKNYVRGDTEVHGGVVHMGPTELRQGLAVRGGASTFNRTNLPTTFAYTQDQKNYVRGDTEIHGNASTAGNMHVQGRFLLGAGATPYSLEKVVVGQDQNALRLTINNKDKEALEIWGNACAHPAGCQGSGSLQHYFQANGDAQHMGNVRVGKSLRVGGPVEASSVQVQPVDTDVQQNAWFGAKGQDGVMAIGMNRTLQGIVSQSKKPFGIWDGNGERMVFEKGLARVKSDLVADRLCVGSTCLNEAELQKVKSLLK